VRSRRGFFYAFDPVEPLQFSREQLSISLQGETICVSATWSRITPPKWPGSGTAMNSRINDTSEQIDHKMSRSICEAVGERLQQSLRPDSSRLTPHLEHLMDELRQRDSEDRPRSSH
jgi:hypothetical protein